MAQKRKAPDIINNQLYDGEDLVWWGQPNPTVYALRRIKPIELLMGLFIAGFATFFYTMSQEMFNDSSFRSFGQPSAIETFVPIFFTIIPAIMFGAGIWNAAHPLRYWIEAQRTTYALTNQRAIVITELLSTNVRSYYDEHVQQMQVTSYGNEVGDIVFATDSVTRTYTDHNNSGLRVNFSEDGMKFGAGSQQRTVTSTVHRGFFAIPNVRTVEDFIAQIFFDEDDDKAKS